MNPIPKFADVGKMDEEKQIEIIGQAAMRGLTVGFVVEADGKKADRYIEKLKAKHPTIVVMKRFNGPTAGVETVKVGPPVHRN